MTSLVATREQQRLAAIVLELWGGHPECDFGTDRLFRRQRQELERYCTERIAERLVTSRLTEEAQRQALVHLGAFFSAQRDWLAAPPNGGDFCFVPASRHRPNYAFRLPSGRRVVLQVATSARSASSTSAVRLTVASFHTALHAGVEQLMVCLQWQEVPRRTSQAALARQALEQLGHSADGRDWYEALAEPHAGKKRRGASVLEFHLQRAAAAEDGFHLIHRRLGTQLQARLSTWLQSEVIDLRQLEKADDTQRLELIELAAAVRDAAEPIIALFATRNEVLQRLLFQVPHVVESHWCATLDLVPQELWPAIAANSTQHEAWRNVMSVDMPDQPTPQWLAEHPHLMVDTAHFSNDFRNQLLASFDDVQAACDGLLIDSENLRALRFLEPCYAGRVRCVFIDPPYNTGSDVWAFADRFEHAAWESLLRDRLRLARELLRDDGAVFISLDDHEQARLRLLLDDVFGEENFLATIVWEKVHTRKNSARHFSVSHDYIPAFARDRSQWQRSLLPREDTAAYANPDNDPRGPWKLDPVYANKPYSADYQIIKPNGAVLDPPAGQYWRFSQQKFLAKAERGEVVWGAGSVYPLVKRYLADVQDGLVPVTLFTRQFAGDNTAAQAELRALFGQGRLVSYPKPSRLVQRIAQVATRRGSDETVLDFFAGSGTTGQAIIELNRADGGRRKYVLVEMRDYFDTVLRPRVMKEAYATHWRDGRPVSRDGYSQMFQYVRLESLEEAIEREALHTPPQGDMAETFSWLLGLRLRCVKHVPGAVVRFGSTPQEETVVLIERDPRAFDDAALAQWIADAALPTKALVYCTPLDAPLQTPRHVAQPLEPAFERLAHFIAE